MRKKSFSTQQTFHLRKDETQECRLPVRVQKFECVFLAAVSASELKKGEIQQVKMSKEDGKSNFSVPKVYNFSLSEEFAESCLSWDLRTFKVENPSFAILLDHTLAVIWHIFAHNGRELSSLDRAAIAWVLKFLEAIDLTNVGDTADLDALKAYMRNLLMIRYSVDNVDDNEKAKLNEANLDGSRQPLDSTMFLALDEYLNCAEVIEDLKKLENEERQVKKSVCSDEQVLQRLQLLNPSIKTLDDVSKLMIQVEPETVQTDPN